MATIRRLALENEHLAARLSARTTECVLLMEQLIDIRAALAESGVELVITTPSTVG
ncbi:MAG: hypothetical protein ABI574_04670 [Burkholderiales bacterium]